MRIYDNLSRPGAEHNLRWLRAAHGSRVQFEQGDVQSTARLREALADVGTVFHLAAQVAVTTSLADPRDDFAVNAAGTLNLLELIRETGRRIALVFTSTNKVYGALDDIPLIAFATRYQPAADLRGVDEARPLSFRSPYGCSKGTADQYVLDYARGYGVDATVFRMSCIYGPHQYGTEDQGWVGADLVLVHEWNEPELVARIAAHRKSSSNSYLLPFHDTHHRVVSAPSSIAAMHLDGLDWGFGLRGDPVRRLYPARLGATRLHLARSRRYSRVWAAAESRARTRPRVDRQLG